MNKAAIYHRAKTNLAYAYDESSLHIRLRTAKNDLQSVSLYCADPYEWECADEATNKWEWKRVLLPMTKKETTSLHDYWFIEIKPEYNRFKYAFVVNDGLEELLYLERGFFKLDDEAIKQDGNSYFAFPYVNQEDIFKAPAWVRDVCWYQIFPERFANGDTSNDPENVLPWGSCDPTAQTFFGGDLQGIIDHLDYLQDLGVTGLYMTPIFISPTTHKYDTIDYFEIDPAFGDKETFKTLVTEVHDRGMKIMLDAVFNHFGSASPQWQDVIKNGENSEYKDWFFINSFPVVDEAGQAIMGSYETFGFCADMPKVNTNHPKAKQYLIDIATYWIREFDIDAWRLDVANEIGHRFWREFRQAVREVKDDVYIVGETWHDSAPWLLGEQFDAVMNYPLTKGIIEYIATDSLNSDRFVDTIVESLLRYPRQVNEVMFNLLDSHDTIRLLSLANGHKEKVKLCYTLLYSLPGSPCLYYGSEVGMDGEYDPLCRKCMIWDDKQDLDYFAHIKKLIQLRKSYPEISNDGDLEIFMSHENVLGYKKYTATEEVYYFINNNDTTKTIELPSTLQQKQVTDLYEACTLNTADVLELSAYAAKILKVSK